MLSLNGGTDSGTDTLPRSPISRTTPSTRRSKAASSSFSASHIAYHNRVPKISPTAITIVARQRHDYRRQLKTRDALQRDSRHPFG